MKTYHQWMESQTVAAAAQAMKDDRSSYGSAAWEGFQGVVDSLKMLAEKNPQAFNFIVAKIKSEVQKVDPSAAAAVGTGGRRFGSAVASQDNNNSQGGV